jgi:hypothetical protein
VLSASQDEITCPVVVYDRLNHDPERRTADEKTGPRYRA